MFVKEIKCIIRLNLALFNKSTEHFEYLSLIMVLFWFSFKGKECVAALPTKLETLMIDCLNIFFVVLNLNSFNYYFVCYWCCSLQWIHMLIFLLLKSVSINVLYVKHLYIKHFFGLKATWVIFISMMQLTVSIALSLFYYYFFLLIKLYRISVSKLW